VHGNTNLFVLFCFVLFCTQADQHSLLLSIQILLLRVQSSAYDKGLYSFKGKQGSSTFIILFAITLAYGCIISTAANAVKGLELERSSDIGFFACFGIIVMALVAILMCTIWLSHMIYPEMPIADGNAASNLNFMNAIGDSAILIQNILVLAEPRYLFERGRHTSGPLLSSFLVTIAGMAHVALNRYSPAPIVLPPKLTPQKSKGTEIAPDFRRN
jgi:hypothetical protein